MTDLEIVQEAQKQIEAQIYEWQEVIDELLKYDPMIFQLKQLNSWLAHKAFFERHKPHDGYNGVACLNCYRYNASYPCPELVAQARLILGVE